MAVDRWPELRWARESNAIVTTITLSSAVLATTDALSNFLTCVLSSGQSPRTSLVRYPVASSSA